MCRKAIDVLISVCDCVFVGTRIVPYMHTIMHNRNFDALYIESPDCDHFY